MIFVAFVLWNILLILKTFNGVYIMNELEMNKTYRCRVITFGEAIEKGLDPYEIMGITRHSYQNSLSGVVSETVRCALVTFGKNWYISDDFRGFILYKDFLEFLEDDPNQEI